MSLNLEVICAAVQRSATVLVQCRLDDKLLFLFLDIIFEMFLLIMQATQTLTSSICPCPHASGDESCEEGL